MAIPNLKTENSRRPWPRRPWQPLMRVVDVIDLDVEALVKAAADQGVDCLLVNAAGFMAWYPTQLPFQRRNPHMAGDFLEEVTQAAQRYGVQVFGRIDLSKGFADWYQQHPGWYVVDAEGSPSRYWELYETCFTGPYIQEYNLQILDELLGKYPLDGLFYNFYYVPRCYCNRCQRIVRDATGHPVPSGPRLDPAYERWRHRELATHTATVHNWLQQHHPHTRLTVYHHTHKGWDPRQMAGVVDLWAAQISSPLLANPLDPQPKWLYWPGEEARKGQSLKPDRPPMLWLSYSQLFASRRVLQPAGRLITHMAQAVAHGASVCPALNGVPGQQEDTRALPAVAATQKQLANLAPFLEGAVEPAQIALVYSPESFWFGSDQGYSSGAEYGHLAEFRGMYAALVDGRYPFNVQMAGTLTAGRLGPYRVVILPGVHCLTDNDASVLETWVGQGGWLVVTADTGLADADGKPRLHPANPILAPLPGSAYSATGGYLAITDGDLQAALGGTRLIGLAHDFWPLPEINGRTDLHLIGPFHNNAPEFTFWDKDSTGPPGIVWRSIGRGRVIRLPWRIGGLYYRTRIPEYPTLLGWLLKQVVGSPPVITDAPCSVEVVLKEQPTVSGKRWIVHLINNTAVADSPLLETIPLLSLTVRVRCPARRAYLAVAEQEAQSSQDGEWITIRINKLYQHEMIVLEP